MNDEAPPAERYDWKRAFQEIKNQTCQTHRTLKPCIFCAEMNDEDAATAAISRYRNDPVFHARVTELAALIRQGALVGAELDWAVALAKQVAARHRG